MSQEKGKKSGKEGESSRVQLIYAELVLTS